MKNIKFVMTLVLISCLLYFQTIFLQAENSPTTATKLDLSDSELQYLQEKKELKVSIIADWRPLISTAADGTLHGVPIMILNKLSEQSNISVKYILAQTYQQSLDQLESGKVDLIGIAMQCPAESTRFTKHSSDAIVPYLTAQTMLIQHNGDSFNNRSHIIQADINGTPYVPYNNKTSTIYYHTPKECFNAVRCGQADITMCDSFTESVLMQQYDARDLISEPTTMMMDLGFRVSSSDVQLISILERTIGSFSKMDIDANLSTYNKNPNKGLLEWCYHYPFEFICFGCAVMFIVALVLLTYAKVNIRQHQTLQGYEESYRLLADTFGEAGIEYDCLNDCLTIFGQQSNLDIEQKVMDFKEKLNCQAIRLSLTSKELTDIINDGMNGQSFSTEIQCGVKSGEWIWYRLIYTIVCTTESHRRPIRLVGCLANIEAEHAEKERLMKLSSNDQLTGLLNHTTAEKQIRLLLTEDTHARIGLLAILDIDHFKSYNDEKGHLCGDDVLRTLGSFIREIFTSEDILCRWGGDEFLFFLFDSSLYKYEFSERIDLLRKKMNAYQYHQISCPVTLSIGGAKSYPGCTFDVLFQQADDALYLAKQNGRNQFWLYAPTEQE
ncbi:MAG: GGDEF domain-containing protein [Lachnospiraceae bacterium]